MPKFKTEISNFKEGLWSYHVKIPEKIFKQLAKDGNKRTICQIDDHKPFHGGLMPDGDGGWFIMLNKEKMQKYKVALGQEVMVSIESDKSKYGMEMPEEFEEVLAQDIEGSTFFENLTDGKKRSLIYIVAKVKNIDKRITKAMIILDHLKANEGKLDFKMLNIAFKENNKF
ncbi:MAG: DUF1905 domain-containing protein [Saprospiraceae bacterium]|nr:YdeI/OmpD-associated family protein [Bacteroidia bacterium]NNL91899.1 DUF1905 domain-containing protein [Saprospiraceae bacterium]